jgi:cytochrome c oxidase cbb3-type subunit 4
MDAGTWRGLFTLLMLLAFIGVCIWAWSRRRTPDFNEAASLPLGDDSAPPGPGTDAHTQPGSAGGTSPRGISS